MKKKGIILLKFIALISFWYFLIYLVEPFLKPLINGS